MKKNVVLVWPLISSSTYPCFSQKKTPPLHIYSVHKPSAFPPAIISFSSLLVFAIIMRLGILLPRTLSFPPFFCFFHSEAMGGYFLPYLLPLCFEGKKGKRKGLRRRRPLTFLSPALSRPFHTFEREREKTAVGKRQKGKPCAGKIVGHSFLFSFVFLALFSLLFFRFFICTDPIFLSAYALHSRFAAPCDPSSRSLLDSGIPLPLSFPFFFATAYNQHPFYNNNNNNNNKNNEFLYNNTKLCCKD
jgi:hypothetical protein